MASDDKRNVRIDLLRAVALFFVVLVHTHPGELSVGSVPATINTFVFFLGKLGVPLFVMISGTLLLNKQYHPSLFYWNRINKILLPWIFWSTALLVYKYFSQPVVDLSITNGIKDFVTIMLSDFWFMPMIAGVYVLQPYLQKIISSKLYVLLVAWFITASVIPALYLSPLFPGSASAGLLTISLSFSGYFILGWYLHTYYSNIKMYWILILFFLATFTYFFGLTIYKNTSNQLFFITQDYFSPAIVVGSIALFLLFSKLHHVEVHSSSSKIAYFLSKISYGVFLSHVLLLQMLTSNIPTLYSYNNNIFSWLISAILLYSVSASVIAMLYQVPRLKKVIT